MASLPLKTLNESLEYDIAHASINQIIRKGSSVAETNSYNKYQELLQQLAKLEPA